MSEQPNDEPIRIGILSTARIAPTALIRPARQVEEVVAYGVAARKPADAGIFQIKHGLIKAYPSYDALLASERMGVQSRKTFSRAKICCSNSAN